MNEVRAFIHLCQQDGVWKGIKLYLGDKHRRFREWRRRYQFFRRLFSTGDHKRRHMILEALHAQSTDADGGVEEWEEGMSVFEVQERFNWWDGEAGMQLVTLLHDEAVRRVVGPEGFHTHFVITVNGVAAIRTGRYLKEGVTERFGNWSIAVSLIALLLTVIQSREASDLSNRIDQLNDEVSTLQTQLTEATLRLTDRTQTDTHNSPIAPKDFGTSASSHVEVLCGECASDVLDREVVR